MHRGRENRGRLGSDDPSRLTASGEIVTRSKHLCVVCALVRHDFEERAPEPEADGCDVVPLAKAWIDGRPYRSVYHVASRGIGCTDCGERVMMTYDPEQAKEWGLALC